MKLDGRPTLVDADMAITRPISGVRARPLPSRSAQDSCFTVTVPAESAGRAAVVEAVTVASRRFAATRGAQPDALMGMVATVVAAFGDVVRRRRAHEGASEVTLVFHMLAERFDAYLIEHGATGLSLGRLLGAWTLP